jgi:hypothetical protein
MILMKLAFVFVASVLLAFGYLWFREAWIGVESARSRLEEVERDRDRWRRDYFHMEYEFQKLMKAHRELVASSGG